MRTKQLGKLGPEVPVICLGAWPLGGGMGELPDQQVIDTVHAAIDCGVTFIDTAEGYRTSESVLGKALAGKRDQVVLATKLSGDHSMEHMTEAIENSLRALGTDYIDLYQLHSPKPEYAIEDTMAGLLRLKDQGKIRYIGVSNFSANQHAEALQYGHIDSSQPMYSMLVRAAGDAVLPFCLENGIGVIVHSPLAKGLLTGKYAPDHKFPEGDERSWMAGFQGERFADALHVANQLKAWAESQGHSLYELAIAWVLANPAVTSCITGAKTPQQAKLNAAAAD
ncbi:MAG: aldo/keto reductase [Candidatus Latescibacteria bacterium]|nr:aldo/keto reductase [Candidatus Latescibacterota bacterium]